MTKYLVTGGTGFIGRSLIRALVTRGDSVRSFDDDSRGSQQYLKDIACEVEFIKGDIRDYPAVHKAVKGVDCVIHLAYINGTNAFYTKPDVILDVAVRGITNVIQACITNKVRRLSVASSSEVYQTATHVPTTEKVPLSVPDPLNPRYSYGGGKIISELMAINFGRLHFDHVTIFRPHNVYGSNMGDAHVIPQLLEKIRFAKIENGKIEVQIQGKGYETRSFCYIDDAVDGILTVIDKGKHLEIYNVGTEEEIRIDELVKLMSKLSGLKVDIIPGARQIGSPIHRCPDITKLKKLGYKPKVTLDKGLLAVITLPVVQKEYPRIGAMSAATSIPGVSWFLKGLLLLDKVYQKVVYDKG
jgi:nucleoside-diphosphate-sugar epimerase